MVLQILKMQQALAAISVTIVLLGSIIISDACNIEPDKSIRLHIQAAQKQEKARTAKVKTRNRVLPIEANARDMALYANTEEKNKSNAKSTGVLKPRSMDTNETNERNLLDELMDTQVGYGIQSNKTQFFNIPLLGQLGNGESTLGSYNPSPSSWLESYIMNQQENSLFFNDKNLEQETSNVPEKQNLDIITEMNNTAALLERKYNDTQHTRQQNTDSPTQNYSGIYLTTTLTEEKPKLETVTETSNSTLISDRTVQTTKDLHTTQTADGNTNPESDTNVFQLVPLLETQTPWFLDEETSVQYNTKQTSMAPASKIQELAKPITDIPTSKSILMSQSTDELGKNVQNSTVLNNMEEMSGAESSTEYNFIRPTRTIHNTTGTIGEMFSTESNKQHSSVPVKGQETQTPTKTQQNNLNSTKETNVKSSQEDRLTIESVNYTLEGRPQSLSDDKQITHGSTISEEKTSINPNVGNTNSVPFTGSTWLQERQTRLRAYIEPFPTTPLPKPDSNGSHIFESTMGSYNITTATTEETSNSFNTTIVTTKETTYNNIHKEASSFMKELTSTLRRQYDNKNFPGKHAILEYVQNTEKLNNEELNTQTERYNVETSVKSNDTFKAPEETFNTDSAISPLKITQRQIHDTGHVTGELDTYTSVGYKSSLDYNTEFQRKNSQSSTDFSNNTPLPYHPQNVGTGTPPSSVGETRCTIIRTDANTNMPQPSQQQRENSTVGYERNSGQFATPLHNTLSKGRSYIEGASKNNTSNNSKPDLFYMTPLHKLQVHESNNNDTNNTTEEEEEEGEEEEEEVQSTTTGNLKENESDHNNNRYSSSLGFLSTIDSNDNLNNITLPPDQVLSPENISKGKTHSVTDSVPEPFQFLQSIGKHSFNITEHPQEDISEPNTSAPHLAKHANVEVTAGPISTEKLTEESHITHSHLSQSLESITESYNLKNMPTTNAVVSPPRGQYVEPVMYFNTSIDKEFSEANDTTTSEGNFDEATDSLDSNHTGGIQHIVIVPAQEEKEPGTNHELKSLKAGSENLTEGKNQTQTGGILKDESQQHFMPKSDGVSFIGLTNNTLFPAVMAPTNYNQVPPFLLYEEPHQQGEEFPQWSQHLPNGESIGDQFAHPPQVPQYLPHEDIGGSPYTQHPFSHNPPREEPPMGSFNVPPFIHHNVPDNNLIFEPYRRKSQDPYQFPLEVSTNISDHKYKLQHLKEEPHFPPQPHTECKYYPVNQLRICVEFLKNRLNQKITDHLSKEAKKHSLGELLDHDPESKNLGTSDSSMEHSNDYITIDNSNPSIPEVPSHERPLLDKGVMYEENTYDHQDQQPIYSEALNESPNEESFWGHQRYNTPFVDQSAQDFNTQNYPNNLGDAHIHYDNEFVNRPMGFNQDIIPQDQIYHEINSNGPITETEFNKEQFTPNELNQQGGEMFTQVPGTISEGPTTEEETAMPSGPILGELYNAGPFYPFANNYYRNIVPNIDNSFFVQPHKIYNQGPFNNKQYPGNEGDGMFIQEDPNVPVFQQQNIHGQFIPPREIINNPQIGHVNGRYFETDPRFQRAENYY